MRVVVHVRSPGLDQILSFLAGRMRHVIHRTVESAGTAIPWPRAPMRLLSSAVIRACAMSWTTASKSRSHDAPIRGRLSGIFADQVTLIEATLADAVAEGAI